MEYSNEQIGNIVETKKETKMSLEERVNKAKELTFVTIPGPPTLTFGTWGSKDDFYRIRLTRPEHPYRTTVQLGKRSVKLENILVECTQNYSVFNENSCDCPGNSKHTICYHAMGALMMAFDDKGKEIEFCRDEFVARGTVARDEWDRTNNNSHFALIQSKSGRGSMWAVVRDKIKVLSHGDMEQRVISMRGIESEEEGID